MDEKSEREVSPKIIYQRVLDGHINIRDAFFSLLISMNTKNEELKTSASEFQLKITRLNSAWEIAQKQINTDLYTTRGVHPSEAPILVLLEILIYPDDFYNYEIDDEGHVTGLFLYGYDESSMGVFPQKICELRFLRILHLTNHNIDAIPDCIGNLTNLEVLYLNDNKIQKLPTSMRKITCLQYLYLVDKEQNIPSRNIVECLNIKDLKEDLTFKALSVIIAELEKKERIEQEKLTKEFNARQEPWKIIYPSKEKLSSFPIKSLKNEYVFLWMFHNNFSCESLDFKEEPLNMNPTLISEYLKRLRENYYIFNVDKTSYMISELGKKRLNQIETISNSN